jgi:hypothetical protein
MKRTFLDELTPELIQGNYGANTATSTDATPEHFHFDWPECQFVFLAVGYPGHKVIITKKDHNE